MSNTISIRKGLNIRLVGEATKEIKEIPVSGTVGISPLDFHGLTPKMVVKEGDAVLVGDVLFFDKKKEKIKFVSPVSGKVKEIVRGEKRRITNVLIDTDGKQEAKKFTVKNVNDYLFYKGNDDYSKYWSTKVHNKMLYTYANNLWKSWKIWKAGTEDVSK